ncbi:MAG: glycoside hydrolase family 3 C-terminal domain-containing protein [Phycisphaerae bacterium]
MTEAMERKIDELLGEMTLEEKTRLCHAIAGFQSGGCERLGIPPLTMSDGPHGVRHELHPHSWDRLTDADDRCTYQPTGTALAATWNRELARRFGRVLGAEARDRGKDVILGPGVNIIRTPLCGRNFEYYSEDPCLSAELVGPCVKGIQENDVACCVKHYALNNQELNRHGVDARPDERTLREMYLPAFHAAAKAGAWTFMGAYNLFRGQHCCHNQTLLNDILKGEWGWDGVVISDWGGTHETAEAIACGLDIEMGGGSNYDEYHLAKATIEAVRSGRADESHMDDKVRRILRLMFRVGLLGDRPRHPGARNTDAHQATALEIARESIVLLKNDRSFLPLKPTKLKKLAVIGKNATTLHAEGGGSSQVPALYEVTPLEGLEKLFGDEVEIVHAEGYPAVEFSYQPLPSDALDVVEEGSGVRGWRGRFWDNPKFRGDPVDQRTVSTVDCSWSPGNTPAGDVADGRFSAKFTATFTPTESGVYRFGLHGPDYCHLHIDGKPVIAVWGSTEPTTRDGQLELDAGRSYELEVVVNAHAGEGEVRLGWLKPDQQLSADTTERMAEAVHLARDADAVLFVGGLSHAEDSEGSDRTQFHLDGGQDQLIDALAEANPNIGVVVVAGGAVAMPWVNKVRAILWAGYEGMEAGTALAEILLGRTNPSGKLPYTLGAKLTDYAPHALEDYGRDVCEYAEGPLVGYRWFDRKGITPLYPFGHGLSYTTFEYSDLTIEPLTETDENTLARVRCRVRNTGSVIGSDVVQLYVAPPTDDVERPVRELRNFMKITLEPGRQAEVVFELSADDPAIWDETQGGWTTPSGTYGLQVGSSSRDIRLSGELNV